MTSRLRAIGASVVDISGSHDLIDERRLQTVLQMFYRSTAQTAEVLGGIRIEPFIERCYMTNVFERIKQWESRLAVKQKMLVHLAMIIGLTTIFVGIILSLNPDLGIPDAFARH